MPKNRKGKDLGPRANLSPDEHMEFKIYCTKAHTTMSAWLRAKVLEATDPHRLLEQIAKDNSQRGEMPRIAGPGKDGCWPEETDGRMSDPRGGEE